MKIAADEPGPDISSVSLDASISSLQLQICYNDEISLLEDIRPYPNANAGPATKNKQSKISSNNHHSKTELTPFTMAKQKIH